MKPTKLLALLGLLGACQSSVEQQKASSDLVVADTISTKAATQPVAQIGATNIKANSDTLRVSNGIALRILLGSKADFVGLSMEPKPEINESHVIRYQGNGRVRREGSKLILTLDSGKSVVFKNDTSQLRGDENEEIDKSYHYQGNLPGLSYWIVEESLYETQNIFLINQKTGVKTSITGEIELSPNHRCLLVSYSGMVYEDDVHQLQLFAINSQTVKRLWQKTLKEWAPSRTRWLDNRTIAVEQLHPAASDSISFGHPTYVRLLLPE